MKFTIRDCGHPVEEAKAAEILLYWLPALRLQDWEIFLSFVRNWDLPHSFAEIEMQQAKKIGIIRILVPTDHDDGRVHKYDMERTLVHELVHLHMRPFQKTDATPLEDDMLEVAIHSLSWALVEQRRGNAT